MYRYPKLAAAATCAAIAALTMSASAGASVVPARHVATHQTPRHVAPRRQPTVARCSAASLTGVLRYQPESKLPQARALLVLTNKSKRSCSLHGYASFGFLGGDGKLIHGSRTTYLKKALPRWFLVKPRGHAYANVSWKLCGSGGANGSGGEWTGGVVFTAPLDVKQITLDEVNYKQNYGRVCSFNFVATALRAR